MRPDDYDFVCAFLKERSGLVLSKDKAYLLENRLMPVARKRMLSSLDELVAALRKGGDPALEREVTDAMMTNESFFFRDIKPFDQLRDAVLPGLIDRRASSRRLRIWCAAASTGQEPYSIAMLLHEMGTRLSGWSVEIVATDISSSALARAKSGLYTQFEVQRGLPIQYLVKYFGQEGNQWQLSETIRRMVQYREFNLLGDFGSLGTFDVIFCRNVLIYFDQDSKAAILGRMAKTIASDGAMFLGGAETVLGITDAFAPVKGLTGVYAVAGAPAANFVTSATQPARMAV